MARMLKLLMGLLVVAAVVVGGYFLLNGRTSASDGMKLVKVEKGSITEKAVAVGQIDPRLKFHVKSKISGIVKRAAFEVGDVVRAGDLLFDVTPDPTPSELLEADRMLESARTAYKLADLEHKRAADLVAQGILPKGDLDAKEEAFEQARIEQTRAENNRELIHEGRVSNSKSSTRMEANVRAPAGGTLLERKVNPGDPVVPLTSYQAGTELATIADMSDLIFRGTVDEIDVGKLEVGLTARLRVGALPEATVTGRISRIAPQAKEKDGARLFDVEIELDPTGETVLRAGYSATADLVIREQVDTLIIPERLILFEDEGETAFVEIPGETEEVHSPDRRSRHRPPRRRVRSRP